MAGMAVHEKET